MAETQLVETLVQRIVALVDPLEIILFGSRARGDNSPSSDIDLMIVMPEGTHRRRTAQQLYRELLGMLVPCDLVVVTPSDLEAFGEMPGLIYQRVLREGRTLYAA